MDKSARRKCPNQNYFLLVGKLLDVFTKFGNAYYAEYGDAMPPSHKKAFYNISACRTEAYGKIVLACTSCGLAETLNGACRNRACPKCNYKRTEEWIAKAKMRLPPIAYYHLVFTTPQETRFFARKNQKVFYETLLRSVKETLCTFEAGGRQVHGKIGFMTFLHTWDSKLNIHPHVHVLLMAGYFGEDGIWHPAKQKKMFPNDALAAIFKTVFLKKLRAGLGEKIPSDFWKQKWVVYTKKTLEGFNTLEYLGRYVKKLAISSSRIQSVDKHGVTFTYRHRISREKYEYRPMRLSGKEFLRRYFQHVLPPRFVRVRYYGLLHSHFEPVLRIIREANQKEDIESTTESAPVQKSCRECKLPLVTVVIILPAFLRGGQKKPGWGKVLSIIEEDKTDKIIQENFINPAYNRLLEPAAVSPGMPPASANGPPGRRVSTRLNT